jgi:hypothetical protein
MLGSFLAGRKNAGIDPGGREEGRMPQNLHMYNEIFLF